MSFIECLPTKKLGERYCRIRTLTNRFVSVPNVPFVCVLWHLRQLNLPRPIRPNRALDGLGFNGRKHPHQRPWLRLDRIGGSSEGERPQWDRVRTGRKRGVLATLGAPIGDPRLVRPGRKRGVSATRYANKSTCEHVRTGRKRRSSSTADQRSGLHP